MIFQSFKNARIVRSTWLESDGRRLDCNPYMSGALEAKDRLVNLSVSKNDLLDLTAGFNGGIYNGPMFRRNYVDSPQYGVPFITSGPMLLADLVTLPLLRRRDAESPALSYLRLTAGTTLISCSGTIGRMVYVRPDMEGMWSSQDVLKVVPDPTKIPSGYLFAFLSSKFGVPLVVSGTYGAIIQHIEPRHIEHLPVPRLGKHVEGKVHILVTQAAQKRADATHKLREAQTLLLANIGSPKLPHEANSDTARLTTTVHYSKIKETMRLEGFFYNPVAEKIDEWARGFSDLSVELGGIADVYDVPPFKHIYVEPGHGVPFFTSGELFDLNRIASKFLSTKLTKNLDKYLLQRDWVLLARSGQLGGIMGRPQYADSSLNTAATSDHVIRLVPRGVPGGYIFAYLYSDMGYRLITRTMTGHSIPALWPSQLQSLPVVLASKRVMRSISDLVTDAFENRVHATSFEREARTIVESAIEGTA